MKALKTVLLGAILIMSVSSCGNSEQVAVETTTTTIDLGDCSEFVDTRWEAVESKLGVALDTHRANRTNQNANLILNALSEYRQFIRQLDVPFIQGEQDVWVFAFTDLHSALSLFWETNGEYGYGVAWTAWEDAKNDFRDKWNPLCDDDYPYPEDIIDGEPANSNSQPYEGYNDGIDQDCADIGRRVYVGSYDPDGLDRDGNGYGCESYGG